MGKSTKKSRDKVIRHTYLVPLRGIINRVPGKYTKKGGKEIVSHLLKDEAKNDPQKRIRKFKKLFSKRLTTELINELIKEEKYLKFKLLPRLKAKPDKPKERCPKCGKLIPEGFSFCKKCRAYLDVVAPEISLNYEDKDIRINDFIDLAKELAVRETKRCVSAFFGNLIPEKVSRRGGTSFIAKLSKDLEEKTGAKSSSTQKTSVDVYKDLLTIKRTDSISRFEKLPKNLQSLEEGLRFFLENHSHHDTIKLKREFYRFYPNIKLEKLSEVIYKLKLACDKSKENPGPGQSTSISTPALLEVVNNLYDISKAYTGKIPHLTTEDYPTGTNKPGKEYSKRYAGEFLDYIKTSIQSFVPYPNYKPSQFSTRKACKESLSKGTLAEIAKKVIHSKKAIHPRRKPLVKISSK